MAEVVQLRVERGVEELLELERAGLFSPEETKAIINKRKEFEYRLRRQTSGTSSLIDTYLKYISYERSLLRLIKMRRKKHGFDHRTKEIDQKIAKRIAGIFRGAVFRDQSDVSMWVSYIDFCREMKWIGSVTNIYSRMLQVHNSRPDLWIAAAKWEFEENNCVNSARLLIQKGLRFNPTSELLFREGFRLELLYIDKIVKRKAVLLEMMEENPRAVVDDEEASNDAVLSGEVAFVIYEEAVKKMQNNVEFALSFLDVLSDFPEAISEKLEGKIISDIFNRFPYSEGVQEFKIQRQLKSIKNAEGRLTAACSAYRGSLAICPTEKMWTYFLSTLLKMVASCRSSHTRRNNISKLQDAFKEAFQQDFLSPDMFIEWLLLYKAIINGGPKNAADLRSQLESIIIKGTDRFKDKPVVWTNALSVMVHTDSFLPTNIESFSKIGLKNLSSLSKGIEELEDSDILSIKQFVALYIECVYNKSKERQVLTLLESLAKGFFGATRNGRRLTSFFKDDFLERTLSFSGTDAAVKVYDDLKSLHPVTESFYRSMICLLSQREKPDTALISRVFEDFLESFGSSDHTIWIDLIKHLKRSGQTTSIPDVYARATKTLSPKEYLSFIQEHSLLCASTT